MTNQNIQNLPMLGTKGGRREVSLYFQRKERGSACGAEELQYLWRQLNS